MNILPLNHSHWKYINLKCKNVMFNWIQMNSKSNVIGKQKGEKFHFGFSKIIIIWFLGLKFLSNSNKKNSLCHTSQITWQTEIVGKIKWFFPKKNIFHLIWVQANYVLFYQRDNLIVCRYGEVSVVCSNALNCEMETRKTNL